MFAETKSFFNKSNVDVSSSLSQKYFGNHVISSQIHLFAPSLDMRRCTLWEKLQKRMYSIYLLMDNVKIVHLYGLGRAARNAKQAKITK